MAQKISVVLEDDKISVVLEDDLTGGPAGQTIRFAVDGTGYEIDLNAKNAAALRKQLAPLH